MLGELLGMADRGLLEPQIVEALADHFKPIMGRARTAQEADEARYIECYAAIR